MPTFELPRPQALSLHVFVKYLTTDLTGEKLLSPSFWCEPALIPAVWGCRWGQVACSSETQCTESVIPLKSQGCAHTPVLCWTTAMLGHISNIPQGFVQCLHWESFFSCKANHFLLRRALGKHFGKNTNENFISQEVERARRSDSTETTQQSHDRAGTRVSLSRILAWHWPH